MKGRFKILGHIGVALFVVSALMLAFMPAAPVQAAGTEVTDVWVQFLGVDGGVYNQTDTATDFTIHFTPYTALKRGVDTITVWFPDGSTAMGPDNFNLTGALGTKGFYSVDRDGEATTYSAVDCTLNATLSQSGYRITVTTPVDLDAGSACSLLIEDNAVVKCADDGSHDPYYIKVYTSKDTTPVASDAFDIDASGPTTVALALAPTTAGLAGQYSFTLTLSHEVAIGGTVTVIFPYGTTVPSSIAADKVRVSTDEGVTYETCTVDPVVNQKARMVTVTTPVTLDVDAKNIVRFTSGAGILNPTTAKAYTEWYASTSVDELFKKEDGETITAATTGVKLGFNNDNYPTSHYSDDATMINMYSDVLYVELQDQYGNLVAPSTEPTISFSSSSGTGVFYNLSYNQISSKETSSGAVSIYYRDSEPGTVTLTASHDSYTNATWTMTIAPGVQLLNSDNNLIKTYNPSVTNTDIREADDYHGGDYITSAINAAVTGDTVKLGDGIYELDIKIVLDKQITLTSATGAAYTTLRPISGMTAYGGNSEVALHLYAVTGTAANPIIIDGLTFTRLRSGVEFDQAILNNGHDYVTVRNCVFNYIKPGYTADSEWGNVVGFIVDPQFEAGDSTVASITSATISNNTFNNCCTFAPNSGDEAAVINIMVKQTAAKSITGATVSGNELTDCNGLGIYVNAYPGSGSGTGASAAYVTANVTDNTITNSVTPIYIEQQTRSVKILRNTVTGGYNCGLWVGSYGTADHDYLVIKNNSFTGCAGADTNSYAVRLAADGSAATAGNQHADSGVDAGANTVQYNNIYDNDATYSIYVDSGIGEQSCQYNYFGDGTGPYYSALTGATVTKSNPNGTGKKVSDLVTYYPWLYKSKADVVTDNVSYQTCTMKLVLGGWNTLSTPVQLIESANAIDELIPSANMTIGYYYGATGWTQIETGKKLEPCDAVYVKMKSTASTAYVQFKFDAGAYSWPSKELKAGWNLISLAALESGGKAPDTAVASVYRTADNLPGYAQVISPSMNATQRDMYYNAGTSWSYSSGGSVGTKLMYAGLGYWIYMQNAATLAGFEITPIAPDLD